MEDRQKQQGRDHDGFSHSVPAVSLPKGGGAIRGIGETFAANPATGTSSVTVPLAFSPGRQGFGPQLSLTYDSGAGNGPFGFGWSLSLPAIVRKTERGLPQYRDSEESDVFLLAGSDDLVPVARTDEDPSIPVPTAGESFIVDRFRPRIEGLFARIERWTHKLTGEVHWRTISRANVTSCFGLTEQSRISDPADPSRRVYSWLICESYDDKGNAIVYEYASENEANVDGELASERNRERTANRYLKRVKYGNRVSRLIEPDLSHTEWLFEAVFDYEEGHMEEFDPEPGLPEADKHRYVRASANGGRSWAVRPDPFSTYRPGFEVRAYRRCRRMLMFHRFEELGDLPCLVRSTEFDYADFHYEAVAPIEAELAYRGSSRFASFIRSVTQSGYIRQSSAVESGGNGVYLRQSFPPLEFEYSKASIQEEVREIKEESSASLPIGLDGKTYRWADLEGEGLSGIVSEQAGAWHYKPNQGGGSFGAMQAVDAKPSLAGLDADIGHILDIDGDGRLEWVSFSGPNPGYAERSESGEWGRYRAFEQLPNVPWNEPSLRFVDLNGDGRADILLTEDEALSWYPSLGGEGFGEAVRLPLPWDEAGSPKTVASDGAEALFLADMSGDGLADLVRIRNGEICYWPNLGYGKFGAKVAMDGAPAFDHPDHYSARKVLLADLDGSGLTDIVYRGTDGVRLYFNQSGNRWSGPLPIRAFPRIDEAASVSAIDLLGNGTACLVWSSLLANAGQEAPIRYIDLMGGRKPNLLVGVVNNLGTETRVQYAPSTKFYLEDKLAGRPWTTKLPFPVHVVERVETFDRIGGNRFVNRYAYHDGFYDGEEREFRGFGMVEQWDTEGEDGFGPSASFSPATNEDETSRVPPAMTRTWYHTGAVSLRLPSALQGGFAELSPEWSTEERREACRALKGSLLRREIYGLDGTEKEQLPYAVSEHAYEIRRLQPKGEHRHSVFLTLVRESATYQVERGSDEPRVSHRLTLEADDYGNALKTVAIGYGRSVPDASLALRDQESQAQSHLVYSEADFTNVVNAGEAYRAPHPVETRSYEVTGLTLGGGGSLIGLSEAKRACAVAEEIQYEERPAADRLQKRLIERTRILYRRDDLTGPLPPGRLETMALPYESYKLALTPGLIGQVYGDRVTEETLAKEGHYVRLEDDDHWWAPYGQSFFSADASDTPAEELEAARTHFYAPRRFRAISDADPEVAVRYDRYDLLVEEVRDELGSKATVNANDYRTLQAKRISDPNGNSSAVAIDALGLVTGIAVMGKPDAVPKQGDSLDGFAESLTAGEIIAFFDDPLASSRTSALLARATSRFVYDLFAYYRSKDEPVARPIVACKLTRETHDADLADGERTKIQFGFVYSDGFGREIQTKTQASEDSEWIGSGWTIFNNKGKPVRQFEPFFTHTHRFESDVRVGVSPVLFYDPIGRVAATLNPDRTWAKTSFEPWRKTTWEASDTVAVSDPREDPDVGDFFRRLPEEAYLPSWYESRIDGSMGPEERDAAIQAAVHAGTPAVAYSDAQGRPFLTVAHNKYARSDSTSGEAPAEELYMTRIVYEAEGKQSELIDANNRTVLRCIYDLHGKAAYQDGMDSGERRMLHDAFGQPIRSWNERGEAGRTVYDALRRPVESYVRGADGSEILVGRIVYGEAFEDAAQRNWIGRTAQTFDQAGIVTNEEYDFKGNLLYGSRRLAREYKRMLDWSGDVPLEERVYGSRTRYDALNRPTEMVAPDGSVIRQTYCEAGLLRSVEARLREQPSSKAKSDWTSFVRRVEHDAKGRRTKIEYGNGAVTRYTYDPLTFRLTHLETRRETTRYPEDCPQPPSPGWPGCGLQQLRYTYDAAGNIVRIRDGAQQTVFFRNRRVEPIAEYMYDSLNRLIEAKGREHLGLVADRSGQPSPPDAFGGFHSRLPHPGDGNAMGTYVERYAYDPAGNLLTLQHRGSDPVHPGWRREFRYAADGNRLLNLKTGDETESFAYDVHGNMTAMPHLPHLTWDYRDQLRSTARQSAGGGTPETTWYVYDSGGTRVRKATERLASGGDQPARMKERIYFGSFEIYREFGGDGQTVDLERETLHILDGNRRIALVETRAQGIDEAPSRLVRYQFGNHLGSASLELDEEARVISYEEYYPYGSTSYQAVRSQTETPKRYRYSGKERDEESGLYYHGARYYSPALCRWASPDPAGTQDGLNPFVAFRNNPVVFVDPSGLAVAPPSNIIGYASSIEEGLITIAKLGDKHQVEFGLGLDQKTQRLAILQGGRGSVSFGDLLPLAHTHTGTDSTINPSTEDFELLSARKVKTHWMYSGDGTWSKVFYDAAKRSFEIIKMTVNGDVFRQVVQDTLDHTQHQDVEKWRSKASLSERIMRWKMGPEEHWIKGQSAAMAATKETKPPQSPALKNIQEAPSAGTAEPPKPLKPPAAAASAPAENLGAATKEASSFESVLKKTGAVASRSAPAIGKALGAMGAAYAAYDISHNTTQTASEQGGLMGAAQFGKTSAKHASAVLWFAAGAALAVAIVAATGGMAAPVAVGLVAATAGTSFAVAGSESTNALIDYFTPGLK